MSASAYCPWSAGAPGNNTSIGSQRTPPAHHSHGRLGQHEHQGPFAVRPQGGACAEKNGGSAHVQVCDGVRDLHACAGNGHPTRSRASRQVRADLSTQRRRADQRFDAISARLRPGNPDANFFDNVAFQPTTGTLVVLEVGEVEVVKNDGTTELRGNDLWMCLPDGGDNDVMSDVCIRFASLRDTTSEPTGFIFTASGRTAYVNLQHRGINQGALVKITGFRLPDHDDDHHDRDHDRDR